MANLLENYENPFDLDGAIRPQPGVTPARVKEAKALIERAKRSRVDEAKFVELFTSSDLSPSIAHLMNLEVIPQLPEAIEDEINDIADYRVVKDFTPFVVREMLTQGVEGAGIDANGAASVVPEGTPYAEVRISGSADSFYSRLAKRGFRASVTFEAIVNDALGHIERLPEEFLKTTVKTIKAEIWDALDQAAQKIPAVTLPDGTVTLPNPAVSAQGIIAAAVAIESREINGTKIGEISAYNLFVPIGQKRFVEYSIEEALASPVLIQDGAVTKIPSTIMRNLYPNVTIRETDRLTGTQWKLVPKPGATKGRLALIRLGLRGYEQPELRVQNDGGGFLSGGEAREGLWRLGFETDQAALRYRFITGAAIADDSWIGVSDGDGVA